MQRSLTNLHGDRVQVHFIPSPATPTSHFVLPFRSGQSCNTVRKSGRTKNDGADWLILDSCQPDKNAWKAVVDSLKECAIIAIVVDHLAAVNGDVLSRIFLSQSGMKPLVSGLFALKLGIRFGRGHGCALAYWKVLGEV